MPMKERKKLRVSLLAACAVTVLLLVFAAGNWFGFLPFFSFTAERFGFSDLVSPCDCDGDGTDDYADLVAGARKYVGTEPEYRSEYYDGGYPPAGVGVCTDVIWSAFGEAGYDLKAMVDADIAADPDAYGIETPDPNIDFRRVVNLNVFFSRHAEQLTTALLSPSEFMPGDILIYDHHIVMLSDRRNLFGFPYIIHHGGLYDYETNGIAHGKILAHYRFRGTDPLPSGEERTEP